MGLRTSSKQKSARRKNMAIARKKKKTSPHKMKGITGKVKAGFKSKASASGMKKQKLKEFKAKRKMVKKKGLLHGTKIR